jgi:hypothetical protein
MSKLKKASLILFIFLFGVSCLKTPEPEPDNPEEYLAELLSSTQYQISTFLGGDFSRYQLMWMQQLSGIRTLYLEIERYNPTTTNFNTFWETYYMELMQRLRLIEYLSIENDAPAYRGVSLVLQAFMAGIVSDVWGDMPFEDANKYFANMTNPEYDSQESLYSSILLYLNNGIAYLQDPNPGELTPGPDADIFYDGILENWVKAARLIRLKYSLRLSHKNQNYNISLQLIQQGGMFESTQSDIYFPYSTFSGLNNPWYTFDANIGHTRMGKRFVDFLKDTDDPRLTRFVRMNTGNDYVGVVPGTGYTSENVAASRISNTSNSIGAANSNLYLLTYSEQKFIESEVYFRMGMQTQADAAYNLGVKASLDMFNARNEAWEAQHANKTGVNLQDIIHAKYLALFLNPEVYSDWRRTGYPELAPPAINENDYYIPRRFLYPEFENLYNSANVPEEVTLNTRVWWDRE